MGRLPGLAAVLIAAGVAGAADVRVLVTSGTTADGLGIARIEQPHGVTGAAVFFLGTGTSLTVSDSSGARTTLLKTGDPLPAPLRGTVNEITQASAAGDLVGILADTNGPDAADAILLIEGGVLRPVVVVGPSDAADIRAFALNARGDLVYRTRHQATGEIYALPQAGGGTVKLGDTPRTMPRRIPEPVIDESGGAAWATSDAVYHWDQAHGVRLVAGGVKFVTPRRGASALAIHETFGVAVLSRDAITVWSSDSGLATVLARRGDQVGKGKISGFTSVGFLDDGSVVFGVRGPRIGRYLRASGGMLIPSDGPGRFTAGSAMKLERSTAIFRAGRNVITAVVRPGDVIPRVGSITDITTHVVRRHTVTFLADVDGRRVVARWRDGTIRPLVADGQKIGSDEITLSGTAVDVRGRAAAVAAGDAVVVVARDNAGLRSIRAPRGKRFDGFELQRLLFAARGLLVLAQAGKDARGGLFIARGRRLAPAVVRGHALPGTARPLRSVEAAATDGDQVVFAASDVAGEVAVYDLEAGALRRIGGLPAVPWALATRGGDVAALVAVAGGDQLVVARGPVFRALVRQGDSSPVGTIESIEDFAIAGNEIVFSARLAGDGVRRALLAADFR